MSWGMVGAAGVTAASSLLSKKSGAGGSAAPVTPDWLKGAPQDVQNRMKDLLNRESLTPEQRVAAMDPNQLEGINDMFAWGNEGGAGSDIMQSMMGGTDMYGTGMDFMSGALGEDAAQNQGINMENVMSYINNDVLEGQIDAAGRDITRGFYEIDAPRSRMAQALSGNTGSTRGGIGDAILERGAMDRYGDMSGAMRGRAYGQALGIGANEAAQNAALMAGNQQMRVQGGGMLAGQGMRGMQGAYDVGRGNIGMQMKGGGMLRDYEQDLRDVEYQNWQRMYGDVEMANEITNSQMEAFGGAERSGYSEPSDMAIGANVGSALLGADWSGFGGGGDSQGFDPAGMNPIDTTDWDWTNTGWGGTQT